jgi:hypothetical protein
LRFLQKSDTFSAIFYFGKSFKIKTFQISLKVIPYQRSAQEKRFKVAF